MPKFLTQTFICFFAKKIIIWQKTKIMNVTIDKFGRIILPKSLRLMLGLTPGKKVNIEVTDEGFIARPVVTAKPTLVRENGFLFVKYFDENEQEVEIDMDVDFNNVLKEVRDERIDKFLKPLE